MTPIAKKIAEKCWRLEFYYPSKETRMGWRLVRKTNRWWWPRTLWPHVTIRLWNGRIAQWNTRIIAVVNDYDITGRVRWFSVRLR